MSKLDLLIAAMAIEEGWQPLGTTSTPGGSASYRRHNPLNLRASPFEIGKDNGYSVFRNDMDGLAAARWDIVQKAKGNTATGLGPKSTLAQLIHVWAPASDNNNPEGYLAHVLTRTGFSATITLEALVTP